MRPDSSLDGLASALTQTARQAAAEAAEATPRPSVRLGTVRGNSGQAGIVSVVLDGDDVELGFPTTVEPPEQGARVVVLLYPPSGGIIIGRVFTEDMRAASAYVATSEGTTSAAYTDLATVGPRVRLRTGSRVIALLNTWMTNSSAVGFAAIGIAVTNAQGTTTPAPADHSRSLFVEMPNLATTEYQFGGHVWIDGLTPGVNTFTAKYLAAAGGTASFARRRLTIIPVW